MVGPKIRSRRKNLGNTNQKSDTVTASVELGASTLISSSQNKSSNSDTFKEAEILKDSEDQSLYDLRNKARETNSSNHSVKLEPFMHALIEGQLPENSHYRGKTIEDINSPNNLLAQRLVSQAIENSEL